MHSCRTCWPDVSGLQVVNCRVCWARGDTVGDDVVLCVRRRRRSQNILDKRSSNTGGAGRCLRAVVCLFVVILFPLRSAHVNMHVCARLRMHAHGSHCVVLSYLPIHLCEKLKKKVAFASAGAVRAIVIIAHCNRACNRPLPRHTKPCAHAHTPTHAR